MAGLAAAKFIKDSSKVAADFQKMSMGFKAILGSADKAAERIKKLQQFSVVTPFEPKQLIEASKTLQAIAGDTMAVGEGLTLVGDAAAAFDKDLQEVALHTARVFAALTEGGAAGESINRLQEMGTLVKGFKGKIQELSEAQRKGNRELLTGAEALAFLKEAMAKGSGAMADLALTTAGKVSTMRGNLDLLRISFGEGINKGLEKGVDLMNQKIPEWHEGARKLGDQIGRGIGEAFQGNTRLLELQVTFMFQKIGEVAAAAFLRVLTTIFSTAIPTLLDKMTGQILEITGGLAYLIPGLNTQIAAMQVASAGLKSQGQAEDFDISDFLKFTGGTLGSEQTGQEIKDHLARLVQLEETRRHKREMEDYEKAVYGTLIYSE